MYSERFIHCILCVTSCPLKRRGAVARDAPRPGHIGRQAEQGGLASSADRRNPSKSPAALQGPTNSLRRKQDSRRQIAASMSHAHGRTCPKGHENGLERAAAPTQVHGTQLRHRRRRRKGDGDVREPQGDDVAQAGRNYEAKEQGAACAARDDPDGGAR